MGTPHPSEDQDDGDEDDGDEDDAEILAIRAMVQYVSPLGAEARRRVIEYLIMRFGPEGGLRQ